VSSAEHRAKVIACFVRATDAAVTLARTDGRDLTASRALRRERSQALEEAVDELLLAAQEDAGRSRDASKSVGLPREFPNPHAEVSRQISGASTRNPMRKFELLITRQVTHRALVSIVASDREEAERLAEQRAKDDAVLWEEDAVDLTVETAGRDG